MTLTPKPEHTATKLLIEQLITEALSPDYLNVVDEGHKHIGHKGAEGGAGHFLVELTVPTLDHLSRVKRHQAVYDLVAHLIGPKIHALSIKFI